ncbi:hypothetical protein A9264_06965 [Vibrio sp. UCD-FRSSP16_10]|uniref:hypothetical protein n=1 Tax=unclassified Vibrio TaxID=2614977 RepID=UPI000802040A|nr:MULTISPECIES: hypothetical protein [unclassified Vibrio]OBT13403.1 hypothetical protein A9264_06965 [Vibrio sp. UCD-FRSSP16_10]OBT17913.1 hypothetical protein A9260_00955 [Vibrio sp. UCD-FRSSP16_30]
MNNHHRGIWIAYIGSLLTPFTCLLSGVAAIVYAGYRLDKDEDSDVVNSHYYSLIRSFFLFLTFFVVLIVTIATSNGVLIGVNDYWMRNSALEEIAHIIPIAGGIISAIAILIWFVRMTQGMRLLKENKPIEDKKSLHQFSHR